jgi:uncharacterized protein YchJ
MMPSRNDPCPCGSGRKYKACHMRADQAATRAQEALGPEALALSREATNEAARRAAFWEADVAPLMETFRETGEAGSLVMVVADGLILTGDVLARRPVGAQARARAVLDAVMAGARSTGVLPERLHVRDAALAEALRPEMEARGVALVVDVLPGLDEALAVSLEHMAGSAASGAASAPWTWAETEASAAELAEFHAACAAYHRAQPWRTLSDADGLWVIFPGEDEPWGASVMGGGSIHYGLALYSDPGDLEAMYEYDGEPSADWLASLRGFTLSMSYDPAADLPKPLRREVHAAGWEVAGPSAFPTLLGVGIPGRRITAEQVTRVAQACRAIVAFVAAGVPPDGWQDPAMGVLVETMYGDDEDEVDASPWPPPERSHPVGPAGAAADAAFVLRSGEEREQVLPLEAARLRRFTAWVEAQRPSRASRDREVRAAELWTEMLRQMRIPAQAVTEHELRFFLYAWIVVETLPTKPVAKYLTRSLRRLFGFYAAHEGIEYPWAEGVLAELDELVVRLGEDDVRDALNDVTEMLYDDLERRALVPEREVPGTVLGWSIPFDPQMMRLRDEMHRHWLLWHDEVVRGGVTDPGSVRDVLVGRQREWENRSNPALGGRTPRELVIEMDVKAVEVLSRHGMMEQVLGRT